VPLGRALRGGGLVGSAGPPISPLWWTHYLIPLGSLPQPAGGWRRVAWAAEGESRVVVAPPRTTAGPGGADGTLGDFGAAANNRGAGPGDPGAGPVVGALLIDDVQLLRRPRRARLAEVETDPVFLESLGVGWRECPWGGGSGSGDGEAVTAAAAWTRTGSVFAIDPPWTLPPTFLRLPKAGGTDGGAAAAARIDAGGALALCSVAAPGGAGADADTDANLVFPAPPALDPGLFGPAMGHSALSFWLRPLSAAEAEWPGSPLAGGGGFKPPDDDGAAARVAPLSAPASLATARLLLSRGDACASPRAARDRVGCDEGDASACGRLRVAAAVLRRTALREGADNDADADDSFDAEVESTADSVPNVDLLWDGDYPCVAAPLLALAPSLAAPLSSSLSSMPPSSPSTPRATVGGAADADADAQTTLPPPGGRWTHVVAPFADLPPHLLSLDRITLYSPVALGDPASLGVRWGGGPAFLLDDATLVLSAVTGPSSAGEVESSGAVVSTTTDSNADATAQTAESSFAEAASRSDAIVTFVGGGSGGGGSESGGSGGTGGDGGARSGSAGGAGGGASPFLVPFLGAGPAPLNFGGGGEDQAYGYYSGYIDNDDASAALAFVESALEQNNDSDYGDVTTAREARVADAMERLRARGERTAAAARRLLGPGAAALGAPRLPLDSGPGPAPRPKEGGRRPLPTAEAAARPGLGPDPETPTVGSDSDTPNRSDPNSNPGGGSDEAGVVSAAAAVALVVGAAAAAAAAVVVRRRRARGMAKGRGGAGGGSGPDIDGLAMSPSSRGWRHKARGASSPSPLLPGGQGAWASSEDRMATGSPGGRPGGMPPVTGGAASAVDPTRLRLLPLSELLKALSAPDAPCHPRARAVAGRLGALTGAEALPQLPTPRHIAIDAGIPLGAGGFGVVHAASLLAQSTDAAAVISSPLAVGTDADPARSASAGSGADRSVAAAIERSAVAAPRAAGGLVAPVVARLWGAGAPHSDASTGANVGTPTTRAGPPPVAPTPAMRRVALKTLRGVFSWHQPEMADFLNEVECHAGAAAMFGGGWGAAGAAAGAATPVANGPVAGPIAADPADPYQLKGFGVVALLGVTLGPPGRIATALAPGGSLQAALFPPLTQPPRQASAALGIGAAPEVRPPSAALAARPPPAFDVPSSSSSGHTQPHPPLPLRLAISLAIDIAATLAALHARGIVHRDVKPGNVVLVPSIPGGGSEPSSGPSRPSAAAATADLNAAALFPGWRAVFVDFGHARMTGAREGGGIPGGIVVLPSVGGTTGPGGAAADATAGALSDPPVLPVAAALALAAAPGPATRRTVRPGAGTPAFLAPERLCGGDDPLFSMEGGGETGLQSPPDAGGVGGGVDPANGLTAAAAMTRMAAAPAGEAVRASADAFSFGVLLWELVTRRRAHTGPYADPAFPSLPLASGVGFESVPNTDCPNGSDVGDGSSDEDSGAAATTYDHGAQADAVAILLRAAVGWRHPLRQARGAGGPTTARRPFPAGAAGAAVARLVSELWRNDPARRPSLAEAAARLASVAELAATEAEAEGAAGGPGAGGAIVAGHETSTGQTPTPTQTDPNKKPTKNCDPPGPSTAWREAPRSLSASPDDGSGANRCGASRRAPSTSEVPAPARLRTLRTWAAAPVVDEDESHGG